jgi:Cft2 family RNA processing exonuclease
MPAHRRDRDHLRRANADRDELLRWVRALSDVRRLALHHGDPTNQQAFRDWAARELSSAAVG